MNTLTSTGIIAIPLMPQPETNLKPMPNYLVIDSQFGNIKSPFIDFQTGESQEMDCATISYKIVKREVLENEEIIERVLLPLENMNVPIDLLAMLFSYERISQNIKLLNLALSNFKFQGDLEGFNLVIDESKL